MTTVDLGALTNPDELTGLWQYFPAPGPTQNLFVSGWLDTDSSDNGLTASEPSTGAFWVQFPAPTPDVATWTDVQAVTLASSEGTDPLRFWLSNYVSVDIAPSEGGFAETTAPVPSDWWSYLSSQIDAGTASVGGLPGYRVNCASGSPLWVAYLALRITGTFAPSQPSQRPRCRIYPGGAPERSARIYPPLKAASSGGRLSGYQ